MSDPSSPGGPAGPPAPDETRVLDDQLGHAGATPSDPAGSAAPAGWDPLPPQTDRSPSLQAPTGWGPPPRPQPSWGPPPRPQATWGPPPPTGWGSPPQPSWGPPPATGSGWQPSPPWQGSPWRGSPPRRRRFARVAAGALLLAAAALVSVAVGQGFWRVAAARTSQTQSAGSTRSLAAGEVASIASGVDPALVDIEVTLGYQSGQAAATGIVLTSTGLVLTNNHVINGATAISATDVGNGQTYTATVVGYDRSHDMAVIQLAGAVGLTTARLGDSSKATVGQSVVAIGNAGGTGGTPSAAGGSLVALGQQVVASDSLDGSSEQLSGLLETDAAIQPGDSGGPLVNTVGQVIAVDTATSDGYSFLSSASQGFAVPVNTAMAIVTQIQNHQASATVHIGATAFLGVEIQGGGQSGGGGSGGQSGAPSSGASVAVVFMGTPAAQIGLVVGDTIVSVDGQTVDSPTTLSTLLGQRHPGDSVAIGWTDPLGTQHTGTVLLAAGPAA